MGVPLTVSRFFFSKIAFCRASDVKTLPHYNIYIKVHTRTHADIVNTKHGKVDTYIKHSELYTRFYVYTTYKIVIYYYNDYCYCDNNYYNTAIIYHTILVCEIKKYA